MLLLKILEKLGRKKVVMDRGPSHPDYCLAKPWTARYYLLFKKRPRWFPFNILIHHILDDDHGVGLHNHPFPYITIIISGGYWETDKNKNKIWRDRFISMPNTINISKNMRFFVYIIGTKLPKVRTYVGWSNDVEKRFKAHNNSKGAKFTRGSKWKLLYQEELPSKSEAMRREANLKKDRQLRSQLRTKLI